MPLTIIALAIYVGLMLLNFATAGISYHVKAFVPVWSVFNILNKLAALCVLPAIGVDIFRFVF